MKTIRTLLLAFCLITPTAQAAALVHIDEASLQLLTEKGIYAAVGGATALGGVVLTILGIKGLSEKDQKGGPAFLTVSGLALLIAGVHIATGK